LQHINAYIVAINLIGVKYVIRHSVKRALLEDISVYIVVINLIGVQFVIRHLVKRAI